MPGRFLVAAAAVVVRDDGAVLFVRRSAASENAPGAWETPNGRLEPGETVTQAVVREVAEETGLRVEAVRPLDTWRAVRAPRNEEMIGITYLCRMLDTGNGVTLSAEHDEFRWVKPSEWQDFPTDPAIKRTLAGLQGIPG